jgi:hypothetical protein
LFPLFPRNHSETLSLPPETVADNTLIYFSSNSITTIIDCLNNNLLFLNSSKTMIMLVGTHQRVYKFKYLGVVLDPYLQSWNDHIDFITNKISRLGMLRKARRILPREICITLYNAMTLPLFNYCSSIWDSCGKTNCEFLDKLQRRAASIH